MKFFIFILILLVLSTASFAHGGEETEEVIEIEEPELGENLKSTSLKFILIGSIITALFVLFSMTAKKQKGFDKKKIWLFLGLVLPIILVTGYVATSTIYLNVISETKGPIHWHADFEIYGCNEKLDIIDPTGLSNRVGNSIFHEHGDDRVHVEGVVVKESDIDLHSFFRVIGGELTKEKISLLTTHGPVTYKNGDSCNGIQGKLQAFVYKTNNEIVTQEKLDNFPDYVLSPESLIPPGDCLIIEFGEEKASTNRICETYKIALEKGDVTYGG